MTDSAATQPPPGWYHAQGDPPGTQRYWDGTQWVGGPQAAQESAAVEPGGYGDVPRYRATGLPGTPASYGSRVIAILIDSFIGFLVVVVGTVIWIILSATGSDAAATIGFIAFLVAILAGGLIFPLWNVVVRQGRTGQTIGKSQQNIRLVADAGGNPVGAGQAFVRMLIAGLLTSICYIDVLWPLFDEQNKRLTDKILNFSVIDA